MEDKICELLEPLCDGNVYRQGSVGTLPDLFITFWKNDSYDGKHYNNKSKTTIYEYDINVYGKSTSKVYSLMENVISTLKTNDFIISGDSKDLPSDDTNYIALTVEIKYRKEI